MATSACGGPRSGSRLVDAFRWPPKLAFCLVQLFGVEALQVIAKSPPSRAQGVRLPGAAQIPEIDEISGRYLRDLFVGPAFWSPASQGPRPGRGSRKGPRRRRRSTRDPCRSRIPCPQAPSQAGIFPGPATRPNPLAAGLKTTGPKTSTGRVSHCRCLRKNASSGGPPLRPRLVSGVPSPGGLGGRSPKRTMRGAWGAAATPGKRKNHA